jgi:hypothetical protein
MSDRMSFEERLAQALRDYADEAVMPFDPDAVTDAAVATPAGPPSWIRPAALAVAGLAAVLVLAVVAGQFIDRPLGFGGPSMIEEADLPHIVANGSNTPGDWNQTLDETGPAVLRTPMRSSRLGPVDGFVNGRTTEMCRVEASGNETDCTLAWVALYGTNEEAQDALALITSEFESADGWGFPPGSGEPVSGLGDESRLYRDVLDPSGPRLTAIYLWREGPLLLAVSGIDDMPLETIREIADQMQERAVDP